jgi:hypothetical protein
LLTSELRSISAVPAHCASVNKGGMYDRVL